MSNDRLTDEQVERMVAAPAVVWGQAAAEMLAREVQECRALRPDCPTCEGKGWVVVGQTHSTPEGEQEQCDCTDGKMPLDKWVALLVETLRSLRTDFAADGYPTVAYVPTIDAVLKMVPK